MQGDDREHQPPIRSELRQFAHALLYAMQQGDIRVVAQVRDVCWTLIEFRTSSNCTADMLKCIALRMEELGGEMAKEWEGAAKALMERLKYETLADDAQVEVDDLEYPYPEAVRASRELASELDDLGLDILALCSIRQEIYPVVNLNRVEHPERLRSVLPQLLKGSVRAMEHFVNLTKLTADSAASSTQATDGTDAGPGDQRNKSTITGGKQP